MTNETKTPTAPLEQPLTMKEAAALLRISEATMGKLLREGTIRGNKAGRDWRISRKAIEEFLAGADHGHGLE